MIKFFSSNSTVVPSECDPNNLSMIKDTKSMKDNYQKCCPKGMFGSKNSSPYCKQLNMNFDSQSKYKKDIAGYYGDETDVSKIKQIMSPETTISLSH